MNTSPSAVTNWEGWLKFFLRGVHEVSEAATETARAILVLREQHRDAIGQHVSGATNGLKLLDYLFAHPLLSVRNAQQQLGCSYGPAATLIQQFESLEILRETTGQQRNRVFCYSSYVALFERPGTLTAFR